MWCDLFVETHLSISNLMGVFEMGDSKRTAKKPSVVSIFSGCGWLDYGFHTEGYETIWANDFAEWACKSFAANFGDVIHYKDITQIDPYTDKTIPDCDIVLGGFPCQDFSIIWKQPGLNGTRGGLFRHFAEFVCQSVWRYLC